MHISIMTKLGMVSSKQFVSVEIEASWLSDCELGTFNIAVVSDSLLEPLGVDLLVGKKVIRRLQCKGGLPKESYCYLGIGAAETSPRPRTSPSLGDIPGLVSGNGVWMTQAKSAADCLQPVIEPQSPFTQSNSGLTYNISTSDLPRSTVLTSLSGSIPIQSPVTDAVACQWYESQYGPSQDNYVSQGRVETTPTTQLSSDDHAAQNVFSTSTGCSNSYSAGQGSFTPYTAATHDVSPAIRHIETEYHDKFTQAQGHQLDEIQAGTRAFPHRSQPSFTCANADVTSVSGTWENFISEDSPSIFQGMTNWSFMPEEITRDTLLTSQSHVTALPVPSIRLDTSMSSSRTGSGSSYLESSNNDPGYSHQCYEGEF
nr:uncharacterized protein CTRU02_02776 [Colletotrichum truncatum]KAF6797734.1 hypothetical protein CTRU02_02776 [Colletotrichum truncatum]